MPQLADLTGLTTRGLLRLYADILTELVRRGVVRSRNAPAGDLGEHLVLFAYGGALGARSEKSWDVRAADGRLLQVKTRLLAAGDRGSHVYSPFRSFDFDACVFLIFDAHTYELTQAVEVPAAAVQAEASPVPHVNGWRIGTRMALHELPGAVDVTDRIAQAFDGLA